MAAECQPRPIRRERAGIGKRESRTTEPRAEIVGICGELSETLRYAAPRPREGWQWALGVPLQGFTHAGPETPSGAACDQRTRGRAGAHAGHEPALTSGRNRRRGGKSKNNPLAMLRTMAMLLGCMLYTAQGKKAAIAHTQREVASRNTNVVLGPAPVTRSGRRTEETSTYPGSHTGDARTGGLRNKTCDAQGKPARRVLDEVEEKQRMTPCSLEIVPTPGSHGPEMLENLTMPPGYMPCMAHGMRTSNKNTHLVTGARNAGLEHTKEDRRDRWVQETTIPTDTRQVFQGFGGLGTRSVGRTGRKQGGH
eukprot:1260772-Pleurochrysis_carterae.AAC.4